MSNVTVRPSKWAGAGGRTCKGAMGFSFAAGTTDGPGAFFFMQGDRNGTAFWRVVRDFLSKPSKEQEVRRGYGSSVDGFAVEPRLGVDGV